MMHRTRSVGKRILSASILLAFVIAGFAVYMDANRRMTVSRNAKYVEDAANQTARARIAIKLKGIKITIIKGHSFIQANPRHAPSGCAAHLTVSSASAQPSAELHVPGCR